MLRNLKETLPGGGRVLGTPYVGRLAAEILAASSTGTHGPGPMANDGLVSGNRYRMILDGLGSFPPGSLQIDELGRLIATESGSTTYQLYEDNILVAAPIGNRTITVSIGSGHTRTPTVIVEPWADRFEVQIGA